MLRSAVPLFKALAVTLLILTIGAILKLGQEVLVHLALAILMSFALSPVVTFLHRIGLGRGSAVGLAVGLALLVIGLIGYIAYWQVSVLAGDLPNYEATIRQKIHDMAGNPQDRSVFSVAADVIGRIFEDIQKLSGAEAAGPGLSRVSVAPESNGLLAIFEYAEPVLHPIAVLFVVLLLAAFMLIEREELRNRVIRLAGTDDIQQTTAALDEAGQRVGRMLLIQFAINMGFGLAIGLGLSVIGLPSPFLWGIFAGILRFAPYIGAIIGLLPPLLIAFSFDPTWMSFIYTALLFAVVEPITGHILEPLLYGKSTGLSPVAIVVSAVVWSFLWGPIGLVLAIPLTICLVVVGRNIRKLEFLDILLGDRPALKPEEMFYQRMLAGDPREATHQAREFLKGRSLSTYYDEIALEAIRRAHLDIVRGTVTGPRLQTLIESTEQLVDALSNVKEPIAAGGDVTAEAAAAFDAVGPDRKAAMHVIRPSALAPAWRVETPVVVLHGTHPLDHAAAQMLAQTLTKYGLRAQSTPLAEAEALDPDTSGPPALVCLSFVEPLSTLHLRAYARAVRQRVPRARLMLCLWQDTDARLLAELQKKLRMDIVATTTSTALEYAAAAATGT